MWRAASTRRRVPVLNTENQRTTTPPDSLGSRGARVGTGRVLSSWTRTRGRLARDDERARDRESAVGRARERRRAERSESARGERVVSTSLPASPGFSLRALRGSSRRSAKPDLVSLLFFRFSLCRRGCARGSRAPLPVYRISHFGRRPGGGGAGRRGAARHVKQLTPRARARTCRDSPDAGERSNDRSYAARRSRAPTHGGGGRCRRKQYSGAKTTLSQAWSRNCIRGPQCAFEMSMFMCPAVHKLTRN